ncbi:MAG: hypothetical protein FJZ78_08885 [Bacteroidetes bacterium]|nr:hypothetical protein [Bacteroidota bacterium]
MNARGSLFECVAMVDLLSSENLTSKESTESIFISKGNFKKFLYI